MYSQYNTSIYIYIIHICASVLNTHQMMSKLKKPTYPFVGK